MIAKRKADYLPGSSYRPDEETLSRQLKEVLQVLRQQGADGILRIDVPRHLILSWASRVHDLREMGYQIESEQVGRMARHRLVKDRFGKDE